jgi:hypothetical protein
MRSADRKPGARDAKQDTRRGAVKIGDLDARGRTPKGQACVSPSAAVVCWDMMGYPND